MQDICSIIAFEGCWNLIKSPPPLLYHLDFIVGLAEGGPPTWYQGQEVSSSSPEHTLFRHA
jgi:hypothetical protein